MKRENVIFLCLVRKNIRWKENGVEIVFLFGLLIILQNREKT